MSDQVFGPVVTATDVEKAIRTTYETWMPTYLRMMERRASLPFESYPNVASWRSADTMEQRFPEQMIPAVQIMMTDKVRITTQANGAMGTYIGTVDILVQSFEPEPARELAATYGFVLGLILTQKSGLDGSIEVSGVGWEEMGVPATGKVESRWLALASSEIHIQVDKIFDPLLGPVEPDSTVEPPPSWPIAESHKLTIEAEPS